MHRALPILLIAGCRQILGIDLAVVAPPDDAAIDMIVVDEAPPVDADRSARKKQIAVDASLVGAGLSRFPLYVAFTDLEIAARARSDGADIHFRTVTGAQLPYEIQQWDPQTGRLEAWVQVDLTAPLTFALHYGEGAMPTAPDSSKVFEAGYAAVWHFEDDLTTPTIVSATGTLNGTASALAPANRVAGRLGAGIEMGNVAQRIRFDNPIDGNGSHTISAWLKLGPASSYDPVVVLGEPTINRSRWFHARYLAPGALGVGMYGNDFASDLVLAEGTWTLVHWVFDGGNRRTTIYFDGVEAGSYQHATNINTQGNAGYLGWAPEQWGPNLSTQTGMNGTLDEIRIQTVPRSSAWVIAEFRNQSDPSVSYTLGPETPP